MNRVRPVRELINVDGLAWPRIQRLISEAPVGTRVLPVDPAAAEQVLFRLQVSAASTLGGLTLGCGGVLVDHGWLRMLGGGGHDLPDLVAANGLEGLPGSAGPPPALIVAYDVLGGRFAINGGGLPGDPGGMYYWGPDTLDWSPLGGGHTAFLEWALTGGLDGFYSDLRWPGWDSEVRQLSPRHGLACYPPPFTAEGQDPVDAARRPVPFPELLEFYADMAEQLAGTEDGTQVHMDLTDN